MNNGNTMDRFLAEVTGIINRIHTEEKASILDAAKRLADHVSQDRIFYIWGPGGHSNLGAMEIFFRAGGLMHANAILNTETLLSNGALKSMHAERLPGYGRVVIEDYGIGAGDLLLIVNAYGINSATIDAALTAKGKGAFVIGISSFEHAEQTAADHPARHPSKKNLHEVADLAIDCKIRIGDAVVEIDNFEQKVGPLSTFANAYVLNCIVIEAIQNLVSNGINPPVWRSGNAPGGDEWNQQFLDRFRSRIRML